MGGRETRERESEREGGVRGRERRETGREREREGETNTDGRERIMRQSIINLSHCNVYSRGGGEREREREGRKGGERET